MPKKSKAKAPVVFKNRRRITCPDCLERDALVGRLHGSRPKDLYCEGCRSQGRLTVADLVGYYAPNDPWPVSWTCLTCGGKNRHKPGCGES